MIKKHGKISGIIGGPPCQGFSTIGKMDPNDPRNSLFKFFVKFVKILNPDFFLLENVRGLLSSKNEKNEKVINIILKEFEELGYIINFKVLNSAEYGVPQMRERLFIIGFKKNKFIFPEPILVKKDWISIYNALNNLPKLDNEYLGKDKIKIKLKAKNKIQKFYSKDYNGFLYNHCILKQREIDVIRSKYIPEGKYIRSITPSGLKNDIFPDEKLYLGYNESKQQKYCRLDRNKPSFTVLTDWYTMRQKIHYDQDRPFSVREVARLQTFPDNFYFCGKINEQYKQIGNAVPVLLTSILAQNILNQLYTH